MGKRRTLDGKPGRRIIMQQLIATPEELAYLAGIADGEGCFVIYKKHFNNGRWIQYESAFSLAMGHPVPLRMFAAKFGNMVQPRRDKRTAKRRLIYLWRVTSTRATELAKALIPYLEVKRRQATLAIEFQTLKDRSTIEALAGRSLGCRGKVPQHIIEAQDALWIESRRLNARGIDWVPETEVSIAA